MAGKDYSSFKYVHEGSDMSIRVVNNKYQQEIPNNVVVLKIDGEMNLYSTPAIKEIFNTLLDEHVTKFLIDMSELNYVDSSGLGALLGVQSKVMKEQGYVRICSPSKNVATVLDLTKLKVMLRVCESVDKALSEL